MLNIPQNLSYVNPEIKAIFNDAGNAQQFLELISQNKDLVIIINQYTFNVAVGLAYDFHSKQDALNAFKGLDTNKQVEFLTRYAKGKGLEVNTNNEYAYYKYHSRARIAQNQKEAAIAVIDSNIEEIDITDMNYDELSKTAEQIQADVIAYNQAMANDENNRANTLQEYNQIDGPETPPAPAKVKPAFFNRVLADCAAQREQRRKALEEVYSLLVQKIAVYQKLIEIKQRQYNRCDEKMEAIQPRRSYAYARR